MYTRKNVWGAEILGAFTGPDGTYTDLYWYARAIQVMQKKPIQNPKSWWFYAAMHGEYLTQQIPNPYALGKNGKILST